MKLPFHRFGLLALLGAVLGLTAGVAAQPVRGDHIESELIAATDAVVPGQQILVGLRLAHEPHWHSYWKVPGDSGLPTQIEWKLPAGWSAGPIQWPAPRRFPVGPLVNFGYDGEVLLPVQLTAPATLKPGDMAYLKARADWLVCKDVCIPGGADLQLMLPIAAQSAPSAHARLFAATTALIPQPLALPGAGARRDGAQVRLAWRPRDPVRSLEFFAAVEAEIEPAAPQILATEGGDTTLTLRLAKPAPANFTALRGVLVANGGPAQAAAGGWAAEIDLPLSAALVGAPAGTTPAPAGGSLASGAAGSSSTPLADAAAGSSMNLWQALLGALLGGLILNLMPCVFPVLSLKLLSLMQHQRTDPATPPTAPPLAAHGLVFAVGVVASFVLLAGVLIALRAGGAQLGWGFQLQTPWVIALLTALFFLIGVNLLGAFDVALGGSVASSQLAQKLQSERLSGSFWTGVLAVVVAAPCTAPFMAAALGYAIVQPAPVALAVFAALGFGMAAPYLALTLSPGLLARLPRPGAWMERFKQAMAFPMFLTCVWLTWVLAQQVDVHAVGWLLVALTMLGMAGWALGLAQRGARRWGAVALAAALAAGYGLFGASTGGPPAALAKNAPAAWSSALVEQHRQAGQPVFVDFTAAWCVTCQANKQLVLNTAPVQQAFAARGVIQLRADWTNRDPAITAELGRFARNGVPLYVLYDRQGRAHVFPELLTASIVQDALAGL